MWSLLLACTEPATSTPPTEEAPAVDTDPPRADTAPAELENLLVVVVDTLRADRLSVYGHDRDTSPQLAAFAETALVFEAGTAQAYWTHPSMASFMTGLHARAHLCCKFQGEAGKSARDEPLYDGLDTLAEQLRAAGLVTAGLVKSEPVFNVGGFDQGFDSFFHAGGETVAGESAEQLLEQAQERLAAFEDPFFFYVHFMDPHATYRAPEPWYGMWADAYDSELDGGQGSLAALANGEVEPTEDDLEKVKAYYDEEVAYVDDAIGRLLDTLDELGLAETTAVLVMADHGEEFGEHGGWAHQEIWQELLHVPMLLKVPGVPGARHPERVQTIDLTTTAATVLGLEPHADWAGRDLTPLWTGGELAASDVVSGADQSYSLVRDERKLVRRAGHPDALFDLASDPGEQLDLAADAPDELATLAAALDAHLADHTALGERLRGD